MTHGYAEDSHCQDGYANDQGRDWCREELKCWERHDDKEHETKCGRLNAELPPPWPNGGCRAGTSDQDGGESNERDANSREYPEPPLPIEPGGARMDDRSRPPLQHEKVIIAAPVVIARSEPLGRGIGHGVDWPREVLHGRKSDCLDQFE